MLQFIQFLEEVESANRAVVIDDDEAHRLVERFGPQIRNMGRSTEVGIEIPMSNILIAVQGLDNQMLTEAVRQLKTADNLADLLTASSAATRLIEAISKLHLDQFEQKVKRFQSSSDPVVVEQLRSEISRELFGS